MAADFDYVSFWENARDALDALDALGNAMSQFLTWRKPGYKPGTPPAFRFGKRPKPADYEERHKAIDCLRKASLGFSALLAEDRFVKPLANVWPPSAPRELTSRFSLAIRIVPARYLEDCAGDDKEFDSAKRSLFSAQHEVQAVVRELECRPDLADLAYGRKRNKRKRRDKPVESCG